ncbi:MAG: RNA polymerase sigma factor [Terriglobales bacterium]
MVYEEGKEPHVPVTKESLTDAPSTSETPAGLEQMFREHHARVFRTAYRITGSMADAEDVLQTVFLRLVRGRTRGADRTEGRSSFGLSATPAGYLQRAAVHAALDLVQSRPRSKSMPLDALPPEAMASAGRSPEAQVEDSELRERVRLAVARLDPRPAAMFALRYFEGCDNREIAALFETSATVVAVILHRARTQVRKELSHYLEGRHGFR